jgi:hypothetical protein
MRERNRANQVLAEQDVSDDEFRHFRDSIDPEWIEEALEATGTATLRRRRLPAEQVVWLVLGMALYRRRPIDEVVAKLDLALPGRRGPSPAPSAIAQARDRLGQEPMRWLFQRCSEKWAHEGARHHAWRGLAVYGMDGTLVRVPDSAENRAHFGKHGCGEGRQACGYPLVRVLTLMALRTHLLAGISFRPASVGEATCAKALWATIPDRALVIADRLFLDGSVLLPLAAHGVNRHWLVPAKRNLRQEHVAKLGPGDSIVRIEVSRGARKHEPALPTRWEVRAIEFCRPGFPPRTLLTSLLDPKAYPAHEIVSLYHERWEAELGYDEVKTEMLERQEAIRSRKPEGVAQELWGVALAYNLVRLEIERIADEAGVPPTRISFVMALRLIQDEWSWCALSRPGAIPRHLRELRASVARFVLPPRRPDRSYPRVVKMKNKNYRGTGQVTGH